MARNMPEEQTQMVKFDQQKYDDFVINHKVIGFFEKPVTLKSGRLSRFYGNWRTIAEDAYLTEELAKMIVAFAQYKDLKPDTFYAVPEGPTKTAILAQYLWAKQQPNYGQGSHTLAMGRGKPKEHGDPKDKYFLSVPRGRTVVIEDVTTTGGSLIEEIKKLKESGVNVVAAVCLMNRNEKTQDGRSVEQALADMGVPFYSMSNALELLPKIISREHPNQDIVSSLVEEFKTYGVKELKL